MGNDNDQDALTLFQGPWWDETTVMTTLHVDETDLAGMRAAKQILALTFNDGRNYYPTRQFVLEHEPTGRQHIDFVFAPGRGIVRGLPDVLQQLATGIDNADTWAAWLAGEFEPGVSVWAALHRGELDKVLRLARRDAYRWSH